MASKLATLFSSAKKKEKKTEPQDPTAQLELEFAKLQLKLEKSAKPCKHCKVLHPPGTACRRSAVLAARDQERDSKLDATRMRSISSIRSTDSETMYSPASTPIGSLRSLRLSPRTPTSPGGFRNFSPTSGPLETIFSTEQNSSGESTTGSYGSGGSEFGRGLAMSPQAGRRRGREARQKNRFGNSSSRFASQSVDELTSLGVDRNQKFAESDMTRANTEPESTRDQKLDWARMGSSSSSSSSSGSVGSPATVSAKNMKKTVKGVSLRNSPVAYKR
eukprot:comp17841_c0_seq1/m.18000 comp17841_c0_seq1/g.18000  ORF comp17841_c0_seq1/g.18000 comp17841_c0_seq1/m.18000 type:complete len:276 (-) comp17841_c0_seq1:547-1374(-)